LRVDRLSGAAKLDGDLLPHKLPAVGLIDAQRTEVILF